jgi:hypothetical protein
MSYLHGCILVPILTALTGIVPLASSPAAHDVTNAEQAERSDPPVLLLAFSRRSTRTQARGLEFAIWSDGVGLCRSTLGDYSSDLVVFRARPGAAETLRQELNAIDAIVTCNSRLRFPPSSHPARMWVRHKEADLLLFAWWEDVSPGVSTLQDDDGREFMALWGRLKGLMSPITPVETQWLHDKLDRQGEFRGYNPERPELCPWL